MHFVVGVEQADGSPSDGLRELFVLYADRALCHKVVNMKDLQPELLRPHLQLKKLNFMVRDKANLDRA